ncbi:MAG: hypothetical protein AVDCRST_MAG70-1768, partial [uncultured Thermomicrobiales bacterium]
CAWIVKMRRRLRSPRNVNVSTARSTATSSDIETMTPPTYAVGPTLMSHQILRA